MEVSDMIFGIFANKKQAGEAISALKQGGYDDISVISRDDAGDVKTTDTNGDMNDAAEGAVKGGAVGGLAGILAGVAAVALPGVGPLLVAGPLAISWGVTGAALGALTGGLVGALTEEGVPDEIARGYEERVKGGDVLVSIETDDNGEKVKQILRNYNAEEITTTEG